MRREELVEALAGFLKKDAGVLLVFLFGSSVSGKTTGSSDIDVALLFDSLPDVYRVNDLREELTTRLKKDVDIAVLNDASPILKMQVLKNGIPVFIKDRKVYDRFFVDAVDAYDDLKQTRKICEESILKGRIYAR